MKNPGGKPLLSKYDLQSNKIEEIIKKNAPTLLDLFQESASFDLIAEQYVSDYKFVKNILIEWAIPNAEKFGSASDFVVELFLQILSRRPDSLIYRKNSQVIADQIQADAKNIISKGSIKSTEGKRLIMQLNQKMLASNGKLNPGTTADITACILFVGRLFGFFKNQFSSINEKKYNL
jgi:triphosphoribosyl-dephospho-CoA synthase